MSYDLQDYWELSRLENDFTSITIDEWQAYLDFASIGDNWKRFDKKAIYIGLNNAGKTYRITPKQMAWALSVVEAIDNEKAMLQRNVELEDKIETGSFNQIGRHFTLRVAWHDSNWNGHICKDPESNRYCSGYHSLLSERIRRIKEENIEQEKKYACHAIDKINYLPPCYWSINLNGKESSIVRHINPAAPNELVPIEEELKSNAMFSWPFAISFNRSKKQIKGEGAYPPNLDNVRIPLFRGKIIKRSSIAFFYSNYSNPFTEEERQYLVIGAAIIKDKGDLLEFGPMEAIELKRTKQLKNKNFPVINWALQFMFDDSAKVTMPYHEYLEKANSIEDSVQRQALLDKIKVAIVEPELIHCFKYVAMDIDDDEAIYVLSKMRQKLLDCKNDGVIKPEDINRKISQVDELTKHCWKSRGYFPGFKKLTDLLINRETKLNEFITKIDQTFTDEQDLRIQSILDNPKAYPNFREFKNDLLDLKESLQARGISIEQFLQLAMLNLTIQQFQRVLEGKIKDYDAYKHLVASKDKTPLEDICNNPYLLVEEYLNEETLQDENTGEEIDKPIELFKIDTAFFPDGRVLSRLDLQRNITINDKRRLRCLILNYLRSLESQGDCFEEASELENALKQYPLFYQQGAELALGIDIFKKNDPERDAFFEENSTKLKIINANDTRYYYLNEIFVAEKQIEDYLIELLTQPKNDLRFRKLSEYLNKSIDSLGSISSFNEQDFIAERETLYEDIFKEKLFILAGGPGSGKSHELLNTIQEIYDQGETYLILTPTGKAALRLKSDVFVKNIEASTIDKWLTEIKNGKFSREKISRLNRVW